MKRKMLGINYFIGKFRRIFKEEMMLFISLENRISYIFRFYYLWSKIIEKWVDLEKNDSFLEEFMYIYILIKLGFFRVFSRF